MPRALYDSHGGPEPRLAPPRHALHPTAHDKRRRGGGRAGGQAFSGMPGRGGARGQVEGAAALGPRWCTRPGRPRRCALRRWPEAPCQSDTTRSPTGSVGQSHGTDLPGQGGPAVGLHRDQPSLSENGGRRGATPRRSEIIGRSIAVGLLVASREDVATSPPRPEACLEASLEASCGPPVGLGTPTPTPLAATRQARTHKEPPRRLRRRRRKTRN